VKLVKRVVDYLEKSKIPFSYYVLTFLFILTLRSFFEIFSDRIIKNHVATSEAYILIDAVVHLHYLTFWIALALAIICLFYLVTKNDLLKVAKVIFPGFIIVLLAPLLDLIFSKGRGLNLDYMMPGIHENMRWRFWTFFGDFPGSGVTPGMKIEIAIILIFSFAYLYIKTSKIIKSLFSTFLTYTLIFGFLATPFIITGLVNLLGLDMTGVTQMIQVRFFFIDYILAFAFHCLCQVQRCFQIDCQRYQAL